MYSWGSAYKGKLGDTEHWDHSLPEYAKRPVQLIVPEEAQPVTKVICGGIHSSIIDA